MRSLRSLSIGILAAAAVVLTGQPAQAAILNLGVDILDNGSFVTTPFYDHGAGGKGLSGTGTTYTLTLNTAAIFGGFNINSAHLFIDASSVNPGDIASVKAQGFLLGNLSDTAIGASIMPLIGGGTALSTHKNDSDNSYFVLPSSAASQLATDSTYQITFKSVNGGFVKLEGINLQADVSPIVPEVSSLWLLSLGLGSFGGLGLFSRKKFFI